MAQLEARAVQGVYVDSYVAGAHKDSFSSQTRVNKILSYASSYGVVLGDKMADEELMHCLDNYVESKKGEISTIVEQNTSPMKVFKEIRCVLKVTLQVLT